MAQVRGHRRKHSRSVSPLPNKHKRSWQKSSGDHFGGGRSSGRAGGRGGGGPSHSTPLRRHSLSPARGGKKDVQPPPKFGAGRDFSGKSSSPHGQKWSHPQYPVSGRAASPSYPRQHKFPETGSSSSRDRFGSGGSHSNNARPASYRNDEISGSRPRQRSLSRRPQRPDSPQHRNKRDAKSSKLSPPSPQRGAPAKKKTRRTPIPTHKPAISGSRDQTHTSSQNKSELSPPRHSSSGGGGGSLPQRRISTTSKKKAHITLHKRFTFEYQEPFQLEENVTIAILRKPEAHPSEEVTVKRVFDASQFKMIHAKLEGRKPIFDREEIKVWRHDENLLDDPDFERRLVRVKSSSVTSKSSSNNVSQMSPTVLRKAIGLESSGRSSRSSHTEPEIRLDPRPDPRYEPRFRKQLEKEEEEIARKRRKNEEKKKGTDVRLGGSGDNRGVKGGDVRDRRWEEHEEEDTRRVKGGSDEMYDLRQALERRRSDRGDEESFRSELRHESQVVDTRSGYRDVQQEHAGSYAHNDGRNVVFNQDRTRKWFGGNSGGNQEREGGSKRFGDETGRGMRGRGRRGDWGMDRRDDNGGMREEGTSNFRGGGRSFDRQRQQQRFSNSPTNTRGWRGGYRGRRGQTWGEYAPDNSTQDFQLETSDLFKYSQHDDRDVSPKSFRGRGGPGHFMSRNFGGTSFRATSRGGGGFRGRARGQRGGYFRGRVFGMQRGNSGGGGRRSMDRVRDVSVDREWKHDKYDSLQAEEGLQHSNSTGT